MTDAERTVLMEKMDRELEEHYAMLEQRAKERGPRRMEDGWTEDNWEEEMQQHPFFNQGWKEGEELSPLMQGMQDLKYSPDENTPEDLAKNYKEDGNFNFKCKKYRFAVASYTEGLRAKAGDSEINTQLFTNRAAAQYHLENYRSSLRDAESALRLTPGHIKAIVRAAYCCFSLKDFSKCVEYCDQGLKVDEQHKDLVAKRSESVAAEKTKQRDDRKRQAVEKKKKKEADKILETIKERGIRISKCKGEKNLDLSDLEPSHPAAFQKRVHLDESGQLVWPVLMLYPEHEETDFIEEFRESDHFNDHLEVLFEESPPWDAEGRYGPDTVAVYFEDGEERLHQVAPDWTLCQALTTKGYIVKAGTPAFIVLVKGSQAHSDFLHKYQFQS